jgi:hypothetical protein
MARFELFQDTLQSAGESLTDAHPEQGSHLVSGQAEQTFCTECSKIFARSFRGTEARHRHQRGIRGTVSWQLSDRLVSQVAKS